MQHYLIAKVAELGGRILKRKDILAQSDAAAMERARKSEDCPLCEVYKDGRKIGSIVDWLTGRDGRTLRNGGKLLRPRR